MSDEGRESNQPGVLRQDGPHRVKVAPGSHTALSPSVGVGTTRLRPAVGAAPIPVSMAEGDRVPEAATLRQRQGSAYSTTEVRRLPGRVAPHGRFAPGAEPAPSRDRDPQPSALEQRLAALAELNAKTSKSVTTFEAQVTSSTRSADAPPGASTGTAPDAPARSWRNPFTRRSS